MTRSFGLVDYKVQEAEYFLLMMKRIGSEPDFGGMQFCASAFVSAARSITFAMQSSLKGNADFESWYAPKQEQLRNDPLAKFFHDFRTVTQHIGVNVVTAGSGGRDGHFYWFMPHPDLPIVPKQDVLSACESYFTLILQLLYECYVDLGPIIEGQQRFTQTHFAALGKTIEDAEEEIGWPTGYTDIGDPESLPWRWELIRRSADGCLIQELFQKWLRKTVPRPEPLPPYRLPSLQSDDQ